MSESAALRFSYARDGDVFIFTAPATGLGGGPPQANSLAGILPFPTATPVSFIEIRLAICPPYCTVTPSTFKSLIVNGWPPDVSPAGTLNTARRVSPGPPRNVWKYAVEIAVPSGLVMPAI